MANSGNKKLSAAASLANLLPTGTALAFQALLPNCTNNGSCLPVHKYLTLSTIIVFSFICFFSSFTDSFADGKGKLYYGIATFKGFYVFNNDEISDNNTNEIDPNNIKKEGNREQDIEQGDNNHDGGRCEKEILIKEKLKIYQIEHIDYLHAVSSSLVFLVYAICSSDVQRCFIPHPSPNVNALIMNLPLAVGGFMSLVFMVFPTKRRGIGFAEPRILKK